MSIDFVPTIRFKLFFVLVVLAHSRRKVIHFNVTENPTAQWTGQQIVEAFPWDSAPKYLLRDRDAIYGSAFQRRVQSMGIEQVFSAPRSPRQNPFVERLIGTLRRECLEHVIVLNERHLKRIVARYLDYYHNRRTHLSLSKDAPNPRTVHPPDRGRAVEFPDIGLDLADVQCQNDVDGELTRWAHTLADERFASWSRSSRRWRKPKE